MPDVAFKDLCLDANRPELVGPFWARLLGLRATRQGDGDYQLSGAPPERSVWVNTVPEPQVGKSRVHLDVRLAAADTEVPGATLVRDRDDEIHWRWMADPDGLDWCAFAPREGEPEGPVELCVDAAEPLAMATWWAERTGGSVHQDEGKPWAWVEGAAGFPYAYWVFNPVPEPKAVKNRMHWDVTLVDADVDALVAAGATVLAVLGSWTVLADPEGNEFCAFPA